MIPQFEPVPTGKPAAQLNDSGQEIYTVEVEGNLTVAVASGGDIDDSRGGGFSDSSEPSASAPRSAGS